ncbi:MAG TPA: Ig-like domain-containing protein [Gemmatimonadales bacterium]
MGRVLRLAKLARRLARLKLTLAGVAVLVACAVVESSPTGPTGPDTSSTVLPSVAKVIVTPPADSGPLGRAVQFTAVASDSAGRAVAGRPVTWLVGDTLVARVDTSGLATYVAEGSTSVSATVGGARGEAWVKVKKAPVSSVAVSPATATIVTSGTVQLAVTLTGATGDTLTGRAVSWSSSAAGVATVGVNGLVSGDSAGTALITATSEGNTGSATVTVTATSGSPRAGYYAAPTGSGTGTGTYAQPWNLSTALAGGNGRVQAGDTIWLRGGTYRGAFRSTLTGTAGAPIVIRQYPGERAVIDVAGATSSSSRGDAFVVSGPWTVWWGFELMSSDPNRYTATRPNMVVNNASHTKYVHLVVHDGGIGFYNYPSAFDVEVTGCVFYNNGWQGTSQGGGHGVYAKSNIGPVLIRDNVMFNQFGYGIQVYSDYGGGRLYGITLEGNTAFNNASISAQYATTGNANLLVGGQEPAEQSRVLNNMTYFSPGGGVYNVVMGSGTYANVDMEFRNNYAAGGSNVLSVGSWNAVTVSGNTLVGAAVMARLKETAVSGYAWSGNTYRRDPLAPGWHHAGTTSAFLVWQLATGLGLTDLAIPDLLSVPQVFVRPSPYEAGRATIVVYNWGRAASVPVDLSAVLQAGDGYEVRNVQALFDAPVATGTGGSLLLPLTGVAPPTVVGGSPATAPRTGPDFDVFVVTKR